MIQSARPDFVTLDDSRDHYVPRFMLKQWLQDVGGATKVSTYRWREERHTDGTLLRTVQSQRMLGLMEVACHRNLNKVGWRSKDEDLESRFATPVDTAAAGVIKELLSNDPSNPSLRLDALDALVRFVVFLQIRSPYEMEGAEEQFLRRSRNPMDARTREIARQIGKLPLALLDRAVAHLRKKNPTFVIKYFPSDVLFTSDRPVRLATDSALTLVALSPRICFAIVLPAAKSKFSELLASRSLHHACNVQQLAWAKMAIAPAAQFPSSYPWEALGKCLPPDERTRPLSFPPEAVIPEMSEADEAREFLKSLETTHSASSRCGRGQR